MKAIFSSKVKLNLIINDSLIVAVTWCQVLEHKIEAAEIAILAKSYIKRFDSENGTFVELHQVPLGLE